MADFKNAVKQKLLPAAPLPLNQLAATGGQHQIQDLASEYWFGALQPIKPVAPSSYRPRQYEYLPGANLMWTPGEDKGGITFDILRTLADSWDLLRLVIETRKDQLEAPKWEIRVKQDAGEKVQDWKKRNSGDKMVTDLTNFFKKPDGFHTWRSWLRMWAEDMFVLDAVALYYARDEQGRIATVHPLDGATINRCLTDQGLTPPYPSTAYQQVVYGTPACDLTVNDLLYAMRNERTNRRYGYSPVEQILVTIGIALRRQDFILKYYTDGNMPEALCFLPSNMPVDKVRQVQEWFDSVMAGDLSKRRRLTFLPGYGTGDNAKPNVVFPKEVLLKDPMDEWLMQVLCYAFSVSPQNLMKQMNRASAEQGATVAEEEGNEPAMAFVEDVVNTIIERMGLSDKYEFAWKEQRDVDPLKQAQIDNVLLGKVYTINETREARGDDPRPEPQAEKLGVFSTTGFIALDEPRPAAPVGFGGALAFGGGEKPEAPEKPEQATAKAPAQPAANENAAKVTAASLYKAFSAPDDPNLVRVSDLDDLAKAGVITKEEWLSGVNAIRTRNGFEPIDSVNSWAQ